MPIIAAEGIRLHEGIRFYPSMLSNLTMIKSKTNSWKIGEAKQNLSAVVRASADQRQLLYNRDALVAAVISAEDLEKLESLEDVDARRTLVEAFSELREIVREEQYRWIVPKRGDRKSTFPPED